jgi:hypothetical protein
MHNCRSAGSRPRGGTRGSPTASAPNVMTINFLMIMHKNMMMIVYNTYNYIIMIYSRSAGSRPRGGMRGSPTASAPIVIIIIMYKNMIL